MSWQEIDRAADDHIHRAVEISIRPAVVPDLLSVDSVPLSGHMSFIRGNMYAIPAIAAYES